VPSGTKLLHVAEMREGRRQEVRMTERMGDMADSMNVVVV